MKGNITIPTIHLVVLHSMAIHAEQRQCLSEVFRAKRSSVHHLQSSYLPHVGQLRGKMLLKLFYIESAVLTYL
jgi:hypothetical protein